ACSRSADGEIQALSIDARALPVLRAAEINEPAPRVRAEQPGPQPVADIEPFGTALEATLDGHFAQPHPRTLRARAGDDRVEYLTDPVRQEQRRRRLLRQALDLVGGVFLPGAVFSEPRQLRQLVRRPGLRDRGFQQTLRDEIREAPVRRR